MAAPSAQTIVEVADRLFAAIEKGDHAAVDRMWSADIALWRVGSPFTTDGKARALRAIDWFITATAERHYEILDRQLFYDGSVGGFVQQHVLPATAHAGQSIFMRVCIVIELGAGGLIARIDEYFEPAEIAPLIG